MSLALLSDVAGRLGGLLGGPVPPPTAAAPALDSPTTVCGMLALRPIDGAAPSAGVGVGGVSVGPGMLAVLAGVGGGGGAPLPPPSPSPIGPPLAFEMGGVERGGGGVAEGAGDAAAAPAALLTHLPRSGSKTNWLASPRLALTGLFGAAAPGAPASFLLPPNQPPNQPDLRFCATGRAAKAV
jgi:hypothetical protein